MARDLLHIEFGPAAVSLTQLGGFRARPRTLRTIDVAATTTPGVQYNDAEPWRAALDALTATLVGQRGNFKRAAIVLSNHVVRYALLPWDGDLVSDAERMAFARHSFRNIFGAAADLWDYCLDEQPAGQAYLASAIDRELLLGLRSAVTQAGGKLLSVMPALAETINVHRRVLKGKEFCVAMVEAGRVTLAFRNKDGWSAIRSRRVDGALGELLPTLIKQEAAAAAVGDGGTLYVCGSGGIELPALTVPGWKVMLLTQSRTPPVLQSAVVPVLQS